MSYILSQILKKKVPEWNDEVLTEASFYRICERLRVGIVETDTRASGEYTVHAGRPIIILSSRIKQQMRAWVMFHELGHHLLHYPATHRFSKSIFSRIDRESNFFAAIALMPTRIITGKSKAEIRADFAYPQEIIEIRYEISLSFGI